MKRDREEEGEIETAHMANLLMQLSKANQTTPTRRLFSCKTCNRQFPSFQALGGHRASHKKPKFDREEAPSSPVKPKTHACTICGLEFPIGQALGGHMRRHRASGATAVSDRSLMTTRPLLPSVPALKRSTSKRVILCLDLNLMPSENEDLKFQKEAPLYRFI
ncbi:putative nucleic acid binding protein [Tripterygium wilfordii]|uniref:Putative nucleic acid binding protein n=1 Tax=Tripterygium wilfordii TaxID=458696 RepID=A0A7J7DYL3_TRIWF|nr:zinc finger protein ZAT12-like [Tripterygium wilfordii]KAF5751482.1 putative nucleic acid binding protein [Tripterygium wilfordii]